MSDPRTESQAMRLTITPAKKVMDKRGGFGSSGAGLVLATPPGE